MDNLKKQIILFVLILLVFLPACIGTGVNQSSIGQSTQRPALQLEPCTVRNNPALCGTLRVYENRAAQRHNRFIHWDIT